MKNWLNSDKMSEKCLKAGNKPVNHIFNDSGVLICLICKENIKEKLYFDLDILLSNHINSKKHQKNVRALFKLCVPSWSGGYSKIVQDLVFDVALERNTSSFVSKTGENFACLVCGENIAQGLDENEIIKSITNHILTEFHFTNLKDTVFWVHRLDDELGFMMLYKSEVHCSICKQSVQNSITCPLKRSMDHLKVHHGIVYKILDGKQNQNSLTDEKSITKTFQNLTLNDNKLQNAGTSSSTRQDLDSELPSGTGEFEDFLGSDDYNTDEESSDGSEDICLDALVCPECGEYIEIYNENVDFSMDLHLQKHKSLTHVNAESSLGYQDNADYVCPICQETIQIFNKNLELSIDLHFGEKRHEHDLFTFADSGEKNRFDFLSRVFDRLPDDNMRDQQSVFVLDGNEVFCKLCNCRVSSSKHIPDACKVFIDHINSTFHVDQLKASSQFLTMAVVNYNKQTFPEEVIEEQGNVIELLCKQNPIIRNNKQFIKKRPTNYYCTVCDKCVPYSPKENAQVFNLVLHFNGEQHKKSLKNLKECKTTVDNISNSLDKVDIEKDKDMKNLLLQLTEKYPAIKVNQAFLKENNGNFFCEICQVSIKLSLSGGLLRQHCATRLHNKELSERCLRFLKQIDHRNLNINGKDLLSVNNLPWFKPHKHFVSHDGKDFCCIICNMSIPGSGSTGKNVMKHFRLLKHREAFFKVVCNEGCSSSKLNTESKIMSPLSTNTTKKTTIEKLEINVTQKRAKKILYCLITRSYVMRKYAHFVNTRNGHFYCKKCKENIICNCSGSHLKEHFKSKKH